MVKIDTSLWNNKERLQTRLRNLATIILSLSAVNGFYMFSEKSWLLLGLNVMFFVTTLPVFISWSKYQKQPPAIENEKTK